MWIKPQPTATPPSHHLRQIRNVRVRSEAVEKQAMKTEVDISNKDMAFEKKPDAGTRQATSFYLPAVKASAPQKRDLASIRVSRSAP